MIVCEAMALTVTLMMRPTYQSTATIELNKQGSGMDLGLGEGLAAPIFGGGEALLTDLQTETAILQGDSLALAVIEELHLAEQAPFATREPIKSEAGEVGKPLEDAPNRRTRLLAIFHGKLRVTPQRGTRLIQVSFQSHDQSQAAQVANQLVEAYKSNYRQTHYAAISETSGWLTTQLTGLKSNVEEAETKLTDFEKANGILSFNMSGSGGGLGKQGVGGGGYSSPEIHSPIIQKLDELNQELTEAEANRISKEAIYRLTSTGNADVILGLQTANLALQSQSMVLTQGGGLSNLQMLRSQQGQLKVELAQAETTYGENNRHLKDIETQIHSLDEQIAQELQLITKRALADFELAKQTEDQIRQQFEQQQSAASKLNDVAIKFAVLSDEAMSHKVLYDDLYTKLQEANISAGIKATNITVVSPARTESVPVRPKPTTYLALGLMVGVFLGLAVAYAVDSLDRTVSTPEEVEEITGRPVIGIIPDLMKSGKSYGAYFKRTIAKSVEESSGSLQVWMLAHPDSVAAEAFRSLRTSIMLSRAGGGAKTILITSCVPGEGKTTLTSNLAAAFAQHSKKVLIVEADMRRPRMMHVMEVPSAVGLSNVLTDTATCEEAIVRGVQLPSLDILPAGPQPPNPSELLGSAAFTELLKKLRTQYDLVLLDSPPALLVADPVSIASMVDAVVWVSRAGVVTRPYLSRAAGLIDRNEMPVIGFVVNGVSNSEAGYGYGSYYMDKEKVDRKNSNGA